MTTRPIVTAADGYVLGRHVTLLDLRIGGPDTIEGDAGTDAAFGQAGNDQMWGDNGAVGPFTAVGAPDYLEGDNGDDTISGEAGTDDIVGGDSAQDGSIVAGRIGTGLADTGETLIDGGPEVTGSPGQRPHGPRPRQWARLPGPGSHADPAVRPATLGGPAVASTTSRR